LGVKGLKEISTASPIALSILPENFYMVKRFLDDDKYFHIPALIDSVLHKDFETGHKKLTPVIFSSGLGSHRGHFTFLLSYLASYG